MKNETIYEAIKDSGFRYTDEYIFDRLVNLEKEVARLKQAEQCWDIIAHYFPDVKKALDDIDAQAEFERKLP
jgi:hypothetical protein